MSHVEITLKSGVTITADVSEWTKQTDRIEGTLAGFKWVHSGPRRLNHLNLDEVAAVVFVDDESDES